MQLKVYNGIIKLHGGKTNSFVVTYKPLPDEVNIARFCHRITKVKNAQHPTHSSFEVYGMFELNLFTLFDQFLF